MKTANAIRSISYICVITVATSVLAQDVSKRTVLEVTPQKAPIPRLKYRLLPSYGQRLPGNAAVYYGKVNAVRMGTYGNVDYLKGMEEVRMLSGEERLASPELDQYSRTPGYEMLRAAALCDDCNWQLPIRESSFASILLPETQQARAYSRFLSLQATAQIRDNDTDGTIDTLQTGYALAYNIADAPTVINGLVGIAIGKLMLDVQELWIEQPEAPNLYWALGWLPTPLVDLRSQMEAEIDLMFANVPGFDQLDSESTDDAFWAEQYQKAASAITEMTGNSANPAAAVLAAASEHLKAKQILIESGLQKAEVEKLPVYKALLMAEKLQFDQYSQQTAAMITMPWWRQTQMKLTPKAEDALTLTRDLWFVAPKIIQAHVSYQRSIDALRTVEALRHYAATHEDQLPDSLEQLTETPAPDDLTTGRPFEYKRDGNVATITSPELVPGIGFGYQVRMQPAVARERPAD